MNPEQALRILDGATAVAPLNRLQHAQVIEAIQALQTALGLEVLPPPPPLKKDNSEAVKPG